jgi:hypothetical protein
MGKSWSEEFLAAKAEIEDERQEEPLACCTSREPYAIELLHGAD